MTPDTFWKLTKQFNDVIFIILFQIPRGKLKRSISHCTGVCFNCHLDKVFALRYLSVYHLKPERQLENSWTENSSS